MTKVEKSLSRPPKRTKVFDYKMPFTIYDVLHLLKIDTPEQDKDEKDLMVCYCPICKTFCKNKGENMNKYKSLMIGRRDESFRCIICGVYGCGGVTLYQKATGMSCKDAFTKICESLGVDPVIKKK